MKTPLAARELTTNDRPSLRRAAEPAAGAAGRPAWVLYVTRQLIQASVKCHKREPCLNAAPLVAREQEFSDFILDQRTATSGDIARALGGTAKNLRKVTPHLAVPPRRLPGGHDGDGRCATGLLEKDATLAARLAELDLIVRARKVDSNRALGPITARDLDPSEAPVSASGVLRL
jgi:hypothetical protein